MKLRSFIDSKRLTNLGINYYTREKWLLDYVKSIAKSLQTTNLQEVEFEKEISEVVKYNGQVASLKAFVDDQVDLIGKRTLIKEYRLVDNISFTGYYLNGEWIREVDPVNTNIGGYYNGTSWVLEPDLIVDKFSLTGYYDNNEWHLENQGSIFNITILIHNDIYSTLTTIEKETLLSKLERYIVAPYSFELKGYETSANITSGDWIDTKIIPNKNTIWEIDIINNGNFLVGVAETNGYFFMGNKLGEADSGYGNQYYDDPTLILHARYKMKLDGGNKKFSLNDVVLSSHDHDLSVFNSSTKSIKFGIFDSAILNPWAMENYGSFILKDGIKTTFTPHPNGYYFDNQGNKYFNKGESSNIYPLRVTMTII